MPYIKSTSLVKDGDTTKNNNTKKYLNCKVGMSPLHPLAFFMFPWTKQLMKEKDKLWSLRKLKPTAKKI